MAFGTVDDKLWSHQKFTEAGLAATGVCVKSWSWSNDHGTNGFISDAVANMLSEGDKRLPEKLAKVGLFDKAEGGYHIHNFTKNGRNLTAERWAELREEKAAAGRLGGLANAASGGLEKARETKRVLREKRLSTLSTRLEKPSKHSKPVNPVTPLTPVSVPFADAKAPYPARETDAATRSQDDGVTMSVAGVASDSDGPAGGAVQPVGKLAEHLMDGRARKAGGGQPAP